MIRIPIERQLKIDSIRDFFSLAEEWELCAWPISPTGAVAFIFKNRNQDDTWDFPPDTYRYKVCVLDQFSTSKSVKFDFEFENMALVAFYYYNDGQVLILRDNQDEEYAYYYKNGEMVRSFGLGHAVRRADVTPEGYIATGYWSEDGDDYARIQIFNPQGEVVFAFQNELSRKCTDLTADAEGNVWFHCMPDSRLYRVTKEGELSIFQPPIAGETGILVTKIHGQTAFLLYTDAEEMGVMAYLCTAERTEKCMFGDLVPEEIISCSMSGAKAILETKDGRLHFCDLSDMEKLLNQ